MKTQTIARNSSKFDRLRLAICGPEKGGKSRLAATGRRNVLFLEFDKRREALAGIDGVYVNSYEDPPEVFKQPTAIQELITDVGKLEASRSLAKLGFDVPDDKEHLVKTVVIDSVQTCAKAAARYVMYTNPELRREVKINGQAISHIHKNWDAWAAEMTTIESIIMRLFAMSDLDVIVILHETAEEAPDSTLEKPHYTGKLSVYPVRYKSILKYFNEIWRVTREDGQPIPKVEALPSWKFTSSTTLDLTANPAKPDIAEVIALATKK